jgi:hypothetical protein
VATVRVRGVGRHELISQGTAQQSLLSHPLATGDARRRGALAPGRSPGTQDDVEESIESPFLGARPVYSAP